MTDTIDHEVPTEAIAAALSMIELLHGRDHAQPDGDLRITVQAELDRWRHGTNGI